jgi:methionine-rich copper-binding protein CopC
MRFVKLGGGLVLALAATAVLAHAHLRKAVPADGGVVSVAPKNIVLSFSEPARLTACWIQKGTAAKEKIDGLATAPAQEISVAVPPLGPGSYVLSWRVVGDDGHIVPGEIHFTIAAGGAAAPQ